MNVKFSAFGDGARTGVDRRGRQIAATLAVLAALYAAGGLVGGAGLGWLLQSPLTPRLPGWSPVWAVPALVLLSLLGTGIAVWAILRARGAILAVRAWTLAPGPEHAAWLGREARAVRPWITLGQWTPVLTLLLGLGATVLALRWLGQLPLPGDARLGLGPVELGLLALSATVQGLPGMVINGLILAAVRRWLDGVVAHAQGRAAPLLPAARALDGWFLFVVVLLGLGAVSLLLGLLSVAFLPALLEAASADLGTGTLPTDEAAMLSALRAGLAALLLFSLFVEGLLMALLVWSRAFALEVAQVLDRGGTGAPGSPAGHPWSVRETIVPPTVDLRP